ncbi:MAG TPA: metallophosphoesterase [Armatimonadota bacterium]|jgi:2',3'-cyclic-nucleotide 2'-phosphodiesterase (5'-nucleotidase family)
MPPVTLLHTSDLHGRLTPGAEERLAGLLKEHPSALLFDSGDACGAGNLGYRPHEPSLEALSRLGCRAMAAGNREAHLWRVVMEKKLAAARFPVLCANLTCRSGPSPCHSCVTVDTSGGARLGVFGLTVPMITRTMFSRHLSDLLFEDPIATARELVPRLRQEHDALVLLSHLGLKRDREIAEAVPGIDVILGGHSHVELQVPERVGDTALFQPGAHGLWASLVTMEGTVGAWRVDGGLVALREKAKKRPKGSGAE